MNKRKIMMQTFSVIVLMFIALMSQSTRGVANYGVIAVSHTPSTLQQNDILTVTVEFSDTAELSFVKLIICQLEPEFKCETTPIIMEETAPNIYTGDFEILFDIGTLVGYHIQLVYSNDSIAYLPDSIDFLGAENIIEPITGDFYYNASYVVEQTEETSSFSYLFFGITLAMISIVIKKKRQNQHR